ncbi:MAG: type IV pilus biogenesis/stability protein PilW [Rhodocyclaceae bacterium]|nr:type IV pilus biogenesis/stability protein PilW [Rhodocyclaceae bacterium]
MKTLKLCALAAAVGLLAACTANPVNRSGSAEFQRPASERPVTSDAQARAKTHADLGMAYTSARRYGVALDEARLALAYDESYAPAHHLKALVLMALEDTVSARASFERAVQLAPGDPEINNAYGWYLCTAGDTEGGLARLAVAARNPYYATPTRPLTNSGLCLVAKGRDEEATDYFRRALRADGENIQAILNLAAIAYRARNYEAAHAYLNTAHQTSFMSAESLWLGVRVERARGDREAEASYVSQLTSRFPTSREYQLMIEGKYE